MVKNGFKQMDPINLKTNDHSSDSIYKNKLQITLLNKTTSFKDFQKQQQQKWLHMSREVQ